jgi:hypothetical protein
MNDNLTPDTPAHAAALALISDLQLILANMAREGLDRIGGDGEPVYDPAFWANECAKVLGVRRVA